MSPEKIEKIHRVGDFHVSEGKITAADPCRRLIDVRESAIFNKCRAGLWHAFVEDDSAHVFKLIAIFSGADTSACSWTVELDKVVESASGQAGLFDLTRYRFEDSFYEQICEFTVRTSEDLNSGKVKGREAWCFDWGVVSTTASGEGQFICYTMTDSSGTKFGVAIDYYRSSLQWSDISLEKILS